MNINRMPMHDNPVKNDYDEDFVERDYEGNGGLRWMSMMVIVLVIFGFLALALYAYNATVMDEHAQEMVQIIHPEQEQYKEQPFDKGGMDIEHQDMESYQMMRETPDVQQEATEVERIVPAPIAPERAPIAPAPAVVETTPITPMPAPAITAMPPATKVTEQTVTSQVQPLVVPTPQPAPSQPTFVTPSAPAIIADSTPAIAPQKREVIAPLPTLNDAVQQAQLEAQKTVNIVPTQAPQVAPAPTGTPYIQLAAVRSPEEAKNFWNNLVSKHGDVLNQYQFYTESVEVPEKGVFYRVRMRGFSDRNVASSVCATLKQRALNCLVAVQ
ncbi:MAG: SPOR domain-containing protein [Alphaproteobacteria bacterium]|nr:MAG: SPOR domain-containing protein [Alphaproteobacteria bacterium]